MTNNKKQKISLLVAAAVGLIMIAADQLTKLLFLDIFENRYESIPVIKGVLSFQLVHNDGAGFSILAGKTLFLIIFTAVALLLVLFLLLSRRLKSSVADWGLALVLSGGIGNMIDRVFRSGKVVDFIKTDFIDFPIFNVADICIVVGAGLLVLYFILDLVNEKKSKQKEKENGEA